MMTSLRLFVLFVALSRVCGYTNKSLSQSYEHGDKMKEEIERLELLYTTEDFARKYGYPFESHKVTTEDGYLLTLHRIPGSPKASSSGVKTPALLMHGLSAASDCWLLLGPEKSLGFILADEGYDVWMGNVRGNIYSRKHATLPPGDLRYNDYTWHEMGVYDLPAKIDYILKVTNQPQLFYIGHSMGGTILFVMASSRPEYNKKLRLGVALAPAVFIKKTTTPFKVLTPLIRRFLEGSVESRLSSLTITNLEPIARLAILACSDGVRLQSICSGFHSSIFGFHKKELNSTVLPSFFTHGTSFLSVQLLDHFVQIIESGRFETYTRKVPNSTSPRDYNLSHVTAPVSLHYALNDQVVPPVGILQLRGRLPNVVNLAQVADNLANHVVFLFAKHVRKLVYDDLLALMKKF